MVHICSYCAIYSLYTNGDYNYYPLPELLCTTFADPKGNKESAVQQYDVVLMARPERIIENIDADLCTV
jgi:hypothetical protein